jgi:phage-related protein
MSWFLGWRKRPARQDTRRGKSGFSVRLPKDAKPFNGFGSGVFEIALRYDAEAYRAVLAVQLCTNICVPHAFQKKSKKGIATPKPDVDLIKQRYKEANELAADEQDT